MGKGIVCRHCEHYYITWDPKFPYGCKAFNFKSKVTPSMDVLRSSGQQCMKFVAKTGEKHG